MKRILQERYIIHIDMDSFFAAIEQRNNPQYRCKPVVVGADPKKGKGRGVVSACSYEARKFGIHSAMPISIAYKKCPKAIFLPVNMPEYIKESHKIFEIFSEFTPKIEQISIDEAFLDITGSFHLFGSPVQTCKLLKKRIKQEIGLIASVGLAPNKFVAKIASDLSKPDGLIEVVNENILKFLKPLDVGRMWGVGNKTMGILHELGVNTIGDLARMEKNELTDYFGKQGNHFRQLAHGIDNRDVETEREIKSISNETTFEQNTSDEEMITGTLLSLCEKVAGRLRKAGLKGKTITLKIRFEDFKTFTRTITIWRLTNYDDVIYNEINKLYSNFQSSEKKIRLVGVKVSNFIADEFEFDIDEDIQREKLQRAVDEIKDKYGDEIIHRAGSK